MLSLCYDAGIRVDYNSTGWASSRHRRVKSHTCLSGTERELWCRRAASACQVGPFYPDKIDILSLHVPATMVQMSIPSSSTIQWIARSFESTLSATNTPTLSIILYSRRTGKITAAISSPVLRADIFFKARETCLLCQSLSMKCATTPQMANPFCDHHRSKDI